MWSYPQVLRHCGILDRISGMVVDVPYAIDGFGAPGASPTLSEIVLDVLGDRDIPVLGNVEFGHAGPNLLMPVGIRVGLDAAADIVAARTCGTAARVAETGRLSRAKQ
ncbi:hypothetical protein [Streptomyces mirabilis]|uniref:hypothetical protein n=1 Tax=Streptomyces mirabilis TaxID=68239 RepID=UPI0033A8456E